MENVFLKVNKDLFTLGLNPTEILILAQVAEFQTNTGDCFISDKTLAEQFGVSESTIKREVKALEEKGFIKRETRNVKGGRERHMTVNYQKLTSVKLSLDNSNKAQNEPCTSVKMSFDKEQIDTIKDNIKDKGKDKRGEEFQPLAESSSYGAAEGQPQPLEIDGVKPIAMTKERAVLAFGLSACVNAIPTAIPSCYWIAGKLILLEETK